MRSEGVCQGGRTRPSGMALTDLTRENPGLALGAERRGLGGQTGDS